MLKRVLSKLRVALNSCESELDDCEDSKSGTFIASRGTFFPTHFYEYCRRNTTDASRSGGSLGQVSLSGTPVPQLRPRPLDG